MEPGRKIKLLITDAANDTSSSFLCFYLPPTLVARFLIFSSNRLIYQHGPFTGRVMTRDSEFPRGASEKNVEATVAGQLNANLLECLCVTRRSLS